MTVAIKDPKYFYHPSSNPLFALSLSIAIINVIIVILIVYTHTHTHLNQRHKQLPLYRLSSFLLNLISRSQKRRKEKEKPNSHTQQTQSNCSVSSPHLLLWLYIYSLVCKSQYVCPKCNRTDSFDTHTCTGFQQLWSQAPNLSLSNFTIRRALLSYSLKNSVGDLSPLCLPFTFSYCRTTLLTTLT